MRRWAALTFAAALSVGCLLPKLNKVDDPELDQAGSSGMASGGTAGGTDVAGGEPAVGGTVSVGGAQAVGGTAPVAGSATVDCSKAPKAPAGALAVGGDGLALRWTGSAWRPTDSTGKVQHAIWGSSVNDVWAFGDAGAGAHWDGTGWKQGQTAGITTVTKLTGSGTENIRALNQANELFRRSGPTWVAMPAPPVGKPIDIWVSPTGKLYAALGIDSIYVADPAGTWTELINLKNAASMGVLSGNSDDDVWFFVRTTAEIKHYDGKTVTGAPVAFDGGSPHALAVTPSAGWAVGEGGRVVSRLGDRWSLLPSNTDRTLDGVAAYAPDKAWVVGDAGTILSVDGQTVCPVASGTESPLYAVWSP